MTVIRALALDPAMKLTGWAVGSTDGTRPAWGTYKADSWGENEGWYLNLFRDWLSDRYEHYGFSKCFYEATFVARFTGGEGPKFMLEGAILSWCSDNDVKPYKVPIQSWRSRFIGATQAPPHYRGNDGMARRWLKDAAIKACADRGWLCDDDNAAEALGILDFGLASLCHDYAGRTDPISRRAQAAHDRECLVR